MKRVKFPLGNKNNWLLSISLLILFFPKISLGQTGLSVTTIENLLVIKTFKTPNQEFICIGKTMDVVRIGNTTIPYYPVFASVYNLVIVRMDASGNVIWHNNIHQNPLTDAALLNFVIPDYDPILNELWIGLEFANTLVLGNQIYNAPNFPDTRYGFAKINASNGSILNSFMTSSNNNFNHYERITYNSGSTGEFYLTGQLRNSLNINNVSLTPHYEDLFIIKMDSTGIANWGKSINSIHVETELRLSFIQSDEILITFNSDTSVVNFDSNPIGGITTPGMPTAFICKLDTGGNLLSSHATELDGRITGFHQLNDQKIILYGWFKNSLQWGVNTLTNPGIDTNLFIIQWDTSGTEDWGKMYSGIGFENFWDLTSDAAGNLFACGTFQKIFYPVPGNALISTLENKAFIFKTDSVGNAQWSQQFFDNNFSMGREIILGNSNQEIWFMSNHQSSGFQNYYCFDTIQRTLGIIPDYSVLTRIKDEHNKLSGYLYIDSNSNGIRDLGEVGVSGKTLNINSGLPITTTDFNGQFTFYLPGGSHTVQLNQTIPYYSVTNSPIPQVNFTGTGQMDTTVNIGINAPSGLHDKTIYIHPLTFARPGNYLSYHIGYNNIGSTIQNDTITVVLDPGILFTSSYPVPTIQSGQTLSWHINSFSPLTQGAIQITTYIPSNTTMGTNVITSCSISTSSNDLTSGDNIDSDTVVVLGPYDPNYKTVSVSELTTNDLLLSPWLDYVIHFQNLGNDTAFQVIILDSLPNYLDYTTIDILASSFPVNLTVNSIGLAKFLFDKINLPHEAIDTLGSCGYVKFRIKSKNNIPGGDSIRNFADIYFDYNEPIRTDTAITYILAPVQVSPFSISPTLKIFPNPVQSDHFNIEWPWIGESGRVEIYSVSGVKISDRIIEGMIDQGLVTIPIPNIPEGIYFGKVYRNDEIYNFKFVVEGKR